MRISYPPTPPRHKRPVLLDLPLDRLMVLIARAEGVSVAQLSNFFIAFGAVHYLTDEGFRLLLQQQRTPARAMKFLWNVQLPEDWLELIETALEEVEDDQEA